MTAEKGDVDRMGLIRVGSFELNPAERMLCSGGKRVELGGRAFDVLLVLVEHRGRLVTKATLLEKVWPRLVVDENNIPAQIASLRRVLGVGAIRTVQGFGYRLELEVSDATSRAEKESTAIAAPAARAPLLGVQRRAWLNRLGSIVGRDEDLSAVQEALDKSCLVTIVGIAGVGKTRLAQELLAIKADRSEAAVAWVSLASLDDVGLVPSAIALALGLSLPDGVDGFAALRQALEDVPLLLILDCAERLGDSLVEPLTDLVMQTRGLRLLVTSQVPLGIGGELVYRLAALPVPPAGVAAAADQYPAIELFAARAAAADRRFELSTANTPLIADICRRLDGIPLALELAAARVPSLGLATLLARLDDRFRLLRGNGRSIDRQQGALYAAFDWSYNLLSVPEQKVFNRLGAFAGSFVLNTAAAAVADGTIDTSEAMDLIGRLVDRSLVTALAVDPPRYILLETARYFALQRLTATGELQSARGRIAATLLDLLDVAHREYWSLDEAIWLHRYGPELDNVRAAMEWAAANDGELSVALFGSAWPLIVETDLHAEGRNRYSQVVGFLSDALPRARIGRFWEAIATYESTRQFDRARYAAEIAAGMHGATGDDQSRYYALMLLAVNWRVDARCANSAFETARTLEDPAWPARLLAFGGMTEGALLTGAGRFAEARAAYQRAVRFALTTSDRQALEATANIVELDITCGNTAAALQLGRPLALSLRHLGRRETRCELLSTLFSALLMAGEIDEARATGKELHDLATRFDASKLYGVLDAMAYLACQERRYDVAARIVVCADAAHEAHGRAGRRPTEERMRTAAIAILGEQRGPAWRDRDGDGDGGRETLDETTACALALGLCD